MESIFLVQVIGIYFLVVGISALIKSKEWQHVVKHLMEHEHTALAYLAAIFTFIIGLIVVLNHNVWTGGIPVVIATVVGWLILVKGVTYFLLPSHVWVSWVRKMNGLKLYKIFGIIYIIIGAYMAYNGFFVA
jgi:hypothetical protein